MGSTRRRLALLAFLLALAPRDVAAQGPYPCEVRGTARAASSGNKRYVMECPAGASALAPPDTVYVGAQAVTVFRKYRAFVSGNQRIVLEAPAAVTWTAGSTKVVSTTPGGGGGGGVTDDPLVQSTDVTFLGRCAVSPQTNWDYGGQGMGKGPGNTIYLSGTENLDTLGQMELCLSPSTVGASGTAVSQTIAPLSIDSFGTAGGTDPDDTGFRYGGTLLDPDDPSRLLVSVFTEYDADMDAEKSHYVCNPTLSSCTGPYTFSGSNTPGWTAGPMALIPAGWQTILGGKALTGLCCVSIIDRTSRGPTVTAFNPSDVGVTVPTPGTRLLGYDPSHPTLGQWNGNGAGGATETWNNSFWFRALAFVPNTRSLLAVGRGGAGDYCYGFGTATLALHRTPTGTGHIYCYDPDFVGVQGDHDYPYKLVIFAYDANDLAAVKAGTMNYWEPVPYATWAIDNSYTDVVTPATAGNGSGFFDPATNRLYYATNIGLGNYVVHVWQIASF
jgi:hypothetical protein